MYVQSAQGQEDDAYATAKNPLEVEVTTTGNVNQSYLILIRKVVKTYEGGRGYPPFRRRVGLGFPLRGGRGAAVPPNSAKENSAKKQVF